MKFVKTAAVLSAALLAFQYLPEVVQYHPTSAETNDPEIVDALITGYEGDADDPETFKVITSSQPTSKAATSSSLIHNSKFNDCVRVDGIDVSVHNGAIDWKSVKADGIDYAIIRIGYRGYDIGVIQTDTRFKQNIQGAIDAGVKVGCYFYTQAITTQEAIEEAKHCIECVKGYNLSMPIYFDVEKTEGAGVNGRLNRASLSIKQRTDIVEAFCRTIQDAGYEAGVYSSKSYFLDYLDPDYLSTKYKIWLAHYTTQTSYKGDYQLWQYSASGYVKGISGHVDLDVLYSKKANFTQDSIKIEEPNTFVKPEVTGDGVLTFTSADSSIAAVDASGNISGISPGTTTVTVSSDNGSTDTITVNVDFPPEMLLKYTGMVFNQIGESEFISHSGVKLTSSDSSVVSVSEDGKAVAVGVGSATITADDGQGNTAKCTILVANSDLSSGDCNLDGVVNAIDAVYILQLSAELATAEEDQQFSDAFMKLYDFNGDGAINSVDASAVLVRSTYAGIGYYY